MRQFLLIFSLVALVMYAGFVSEHGTSVASATRQEGALAPLQAAFDATGAGVENVQLTGWVPVRSPEALAVVQGDLGWTTSPGAAEFRDAKVHRRDQKHFLAVRWVLKGKDTVRWHQVYTRLEQALAKVGPGPSITVQLEGRSMRNNPLEQADQALNALRAGQRQPWSDSYAASVSGKSGLLPAGPFGINVQVAVRREQTGKGTRVWVAWPALQQEY